MGASRWQTIRTIVLPNSIAGILGGGLGGQVLGLLGLAAGGGTDLTGILGSVASGGVGGGLLMALLGVVRKAMSK